VRIFAHVFFDPETDRSGGVSIHQPRGAATFTKDYNQGNTAQSAMARAADAAGVPICATAAGAYRSQGHRTGLHQALPNRRLENASV
jgi:hypothetical protein